MGTLRGCFRTVPDAPGHCGAAEPADFMFFCRRLAYSRRARRELRVPPPPSVALPPPPPVEPVPHPWYKRIAVPVPHTCRTLPGTCSRIGYRFSRSFGFSENLKSSDFSKFSEKSGISDFSERSERLKRLERLKRCFSSF